MFTQTLMVPVALPDFVLLRTTQWHEHSSDAYIYVRTFNGMIYIVVWNHCS